MKVLSYLQKTWIAWRKAFTREHRSVTEWRERTCEANLLIAGRRSDTEHRCEPGLGTEWLLVLPAMAVSVPLVAGHCYRKRQPVHGAVNV